ncbi:MAG: MFS transporter [Prevotella sp.]|nr:MFS transporter [Prevotella sp.]
MKIKGLRWYIIGLIMLITIINYLDRGTLNYMWLANIDYQLMTVQPSGPVDGNYAVCSGNSYVLTDSKGNRQLVAAESVTKKEKDGTVYITNREGIAIDLGLVSRDDPEASQKAKDLLGTITIFFMIAYGISQLMSGRLYDKVGCRKGFFGSVLIWGLADALASLSRGMVSLTCFRMMLGLGEAGPWPGTTKSNAEWFPQKERALAQGLFGAAASVGSILAPVVILMLFIAFGWKITFVIVGSLGLLWLVPWLVINKKGPEEHPWITREERDYIINGRPVCKQPAAADKGKSWGELLREKKNWSVILGRFFLDPIWWMFVTFLPLYLADVFHLNIKEVAFSAWVPYVGAAIGSIVGGWFSGWLINRGRSVNYARKCAILVGGVIIIPAVILAITAPSAPLAVVYMAVVLGGFQFFMTNLQTIPSDLHKGKSVGSLAGLGGAAAVLGTILAILFSGYITSWTLLFSLLAALVPLSWLSVFLTVGEIKQIED